ncbi:hypothetical protein Hsero_3524 [Herbaspirillum seropedicae SmR1]|uniref:Uncharacterized protein n=1 Tax=Herbaspirillum seropedicae (strain SmR1) TaxID=757424 RepID=D8IQ91_HERSS|nr:hypothetical protein Hsero_3524 [Herbaspirillum seropedicae SmR1]
MVEAEISAISVRMNPARHGPKDKVSELEGRRPLRTNNRRQLDQSKNHASQPSDPMLRPRRTPASATAPHPPIQDVTDNFIFCLINYTDTP